MGNVPTDVLTTEFAYSFYVLFFGAAVVVVAGYKFINLLYKQKEAEKQSMISGYEEKITELKEEYKKEFEKFKDEVRSEDKTLQYKVEQLGKDLELNTKEINKKITEERRERENTLNRVDIKHAKNIVNLHGEVDRTNGIINSLAKELKRDCQRTDDAFIQLYRDMAGFKEKR